MAGPEGETLCRPARPRAPVDFLRRAVDHWPNLPGLRVQLADALLREGRRASAEQALRTAAEEFPRDGRIHAELSRVGGQAGPIFLAPATGRAAPIGFPPPPIDTRAPPPPAPRLREPMLREAAETPAPGKTVWFGTALALLIGACLAVIILHPWRGHVLVGMQDVSVAIVPSPLHPAPLHPAPTYTVPQKPAPQQLAQLSSHTHANPVPSHHPVPSIEPSLHPSAHTASVSPPQRHPALPPASAPAPAAETDAPPRPVTAPSPPPVAPAPRSDADTAFAALPQAPFEHIVIVYPRHAAAAAARLRAALQQSGLPSDFRPVPRTTPPSIAYFYAEDREAADRVADVVGLGAPRLARAPHGFVPPGTIRIALP